MGYSRKNKNFSPLPFPSPAPTRRLERMPSSLGDVVRSIRGNIYRTEFWIMQWGERLFLAIAFGSPPSASRSGRWRGRWAQSRGGLEGDRNRATSIRSEEHTSELQ